VVWKNTGATLHSVTADPSKAQTASHVSLPKGAKEFDSGFMPPGATFSQTFTIPGEYKYICIPHEQNGMIGEVEVKK
jgi:plastocyanin